MSYAHIDVRPVAGMVGAEIHGVDISQDLAPDVVAEIRRAWAEYCVIFFRDQKLTPAQQFAFAEAFGQPVEYPFVDGIEGFPTITPVVKYEHETVNFGGLWHTDTTYQEIPPVGSMLYALEIPPYGGDTLFASGYQAYEALSDGLKEALEPLVGVFSSHKGRVVDTRAEGAKDAPREAASTVKIAKHRIVQTHPETGRKTLYISFAHTTNFDGMTVEESRPILDYLFDHITRPEFTCRFRWEPGSLAFWDNRCAQHNPINDYHGFKRVMHRITLAGQPDIGSGATH